MDNNIYSQFLIILGKINVIETRISFIIIARYVRYKWTKQQYFIFTTIVANIDKTKMIEMNTNCKSFCITFGKL